MDTSGGSQLTARERPAVRTDGAQALRAIGPWLGQAALPFLLVLYLGLRGGGYDEIVRSEVGVAAWWIVLLGVAAGALPLARLRRPAWLALGLLGAFAVWTAIGIGWSESAERSAAELGRVAMLAGVFALVLAAQGPDGLRRTVGGVALGIAAVGILALVSRLQPEWFGEPEAAGVIPATAERLEYPLGYWNGLAELAAMGVPLLLVVATAARATLVRALAVAVLPALALTIYFTYSRGGALAAGLGVLAVLALHPRRLALLPSLTLAAAGSAILVAAASQRDALGDALETPTALAQGNEILAMTITVCAGVALVQAAITLAQRSGIGPRPAISRDAARAGAAGLAVVALGVAVVTGAPGELADGWDEFTAQPGAVDTGGERFSSAAGHGRYQFWEAAVDAGASSPFTGIGPGTYEFWWAREGSLPTFVRDAHSLYLETFAELGILGLLLILALVGLPLAVAVRHARAAPPERRVLLAGAGGALAVFAFAAAIDWAWELTVLPVAFLVLAAAVVAGEPAPAAPRAARAGLPARLAVAGIALAALAAIAIPLASASALSQSESAAEAARLDAALAEARTAAGIQPYGASSRLQEALVLEAAGAFDAAAGAARLATEKEPENWRPWLVLSRIEAFRGNAEASVDAYREARSLGPRLAVFE